VKITATYTHTDQRRWRNEKDRTVNIYRAVFNNCFWTQSQHKDPQTATRAMKRRDCQMISLYERIPGTENDWNEGGYTGWRKVAETRTDGLYVLNQGDWDRVNPINPIKPIAP
jgi:hypothetical protein